MFLTSAFLLFLPYCATAYEPAAENLEAREWFKDSKFGLFVHWGVYSVLGDGEWVMEHQKMNVKDYEKLPSRFNPTGFDPALWVAMVKAAGMKYITITSKHHDGFAMWDSRVSDWNIVRRTPYKKDVLKMLADECHKQGIKLFFYYSHLDWHHPDYYPLGRTGKNAGRSGQGHFDHYLEYMDAQLAELCGGHYGPIAGIWFDGWWDQHDKLSAINDPAQSNVDWHLSRTYEVIHNLQPQALIGNNHHLLPFPGEDFQMFEKDLPGGNTSGFNADNKPSDLPLETCETINCSWGYDQNDKTFKSSKELVHYLVKAAGMNTNFLLNIGPMPSGKIQQDFIDRLKEVGQWLSKNGESVYGTRGGPIPPQPWGVTTIAPKTRQVYVHVLEPNESIILTGQAGKFQRARRLDGTPITMLANGSDLVIELNENELDPIDTVILLEPYKA